MYDASEEKVLNAIKYFVKHTKYVGRTKLFKLLYFWDFMHFKKYGMSITGYQYYTFPFGPVPQKLYEQITKNELPEAFRKAFSIIPDNSDEDEFNDFIKFKVVLKDKKIDLDWLSPNEKEILEQVVEIFKFSNAKQMTEVTHLHNSPWDKTIQTKGMGKIIDYKLAIDDESTLDPQTIDEYLTLQKEIYHYGRF